MISRRVLLGAAAAIAVSSGASVAQAQTEITWWHAMGGALGEKLEEIADDFNAAQTRLQGRRRSSRAPTPRR